MSERNVFISNQPVNQTNGDDVIIVEKNWFWI